MYNPKGFVSSTFDSNNISSGVKIANDAVTYVQSGIQDLNKKMVLSYLHKSIKALNQIAFDYTKGLVDSNIASQS